MEQLTSSNALLKKVKAVVARSDPSEWENIIPYDREAPHDEVKITA